VNQLFSRGMLKSKAPQVARVISQSIEYWHYIGYSNPSEETSYGLLYFAYFILKIIRGSRDLQEVEGINKKLDQLRTAINNMLEALDELNTESLLIDITQIKVMLCNCIRNIVVITDSEAEKKRDIFISKDAEFGLTGAGFDEEGIYEELPSEKEGQAFVIFDEKKTILKDELIIKEGTKRLLDHVRRELIKSRKSFQMWSEVLVFRPDKDFFGLLKRLLNLQVDDNSLEQVFYYIDRKEKGQDNFSSTRLKEGGRVSQKKFLHLLNLFEEELLYFKTKQKIYNFSFNIKKKFNSRYPTSDEIENTGLSVSSQGSLERILGLFWKELMAGDKQNEELEFTIQKLREKVLILGDVDSVIHFFKYLLKLFIKAKRLRYLIRCLNEIMNKSKPDDDEDPEAAELKAYQWFQGVLLDAQLPRVIVWFICQTEDRAVIIEASQLLLNLLLFGNHAVQVSLFKIFQENWLTKNFLKILKDSFSDYLNRLHRNSTKRAFQKSISLTDKSQSNDTVLLNREEAMATNALHLLKLFCDNCYLDFQVRYEITVELPQAPMHTAVDRKPSFFRYCHSCRRVLCISNEAQSRLLGSEHKPVDQDGRELPDRVGDRALPPEPTPSDREQEAAGGPEQHPSPEPAHEPGAIEPPGGVGPAAERVRDRNMC
jgi:hypothetical protein